MDITNQITNTDEVLKDIENLMVKTISATYAVLQVKHGIVAPVIDPETFGMIMAIALEGY